MRRAAVAVAMLALLVGACGQTGRNDGAPPGAVAGGGAGGSGDASGGGSTCCGSAGGSGGSECSCEVPASSHGVVPMHRLRGAEYQNTIADLFDVSAAAPVADSGPPFAAIIDDAQPWFEAAGRVARELFAKAQLPASLVCVTAEGGDRDCALSVIEQLGLRAFRRPLLEAEKQAFTALYDQLLPIDGARVALEQVVRALLLSPAFLFHVELSDNPDALVPERLDSYALAARLSFALWSTTPDADLLEAASRDLSGDAALDAAYERLSQDERVLALPDGLSEVWIGANDLVSHRVDGNVLPRFDEALRLDMLGEQRELMRQFWLQPVPLSELLTLDVNYVSPKLADLYGFAAGTQGFATVSDDARVGLLGQAAFLTLSSFERRASATHRGKLVLQRLLCVKIPDPPPGEADSLGSTFPPGTSERQALEQQLTSPVCAACHAPMDAIGFALARFDAIGAYRERDSQNLPIDTRVQLPELIAPGQPSVDGLPELASTLASTRRFRACVAQQVASYLIHRDVSEETDADLIWPLVDRVSEQGDLSELTRQIVMSDHFRYRRLEPTL